MERVPYAQKLRAVGHVTNVRGESLSRRRELDQLSPVIDLVGKAVRRLIDIHGPNELEVAS